MHPNPQDARRQPGAYVVILFPCLFIIVFLMHFHRVGDLFRFRWHYVPRDPALVVSSLVRAQNHWPMLHDPHILGYLGLPLLLFCAFALYQLSREARPRLSAVSLFVTVSGTIYLGGLFGMWTAFYRGLGSVDPYYLDGAIATFRGMTAPRGAFLLTTTLAKFSLIGLGLQSLVLCRLPAIPIRSAVLITSGCFLIVAFWDLDNWMLIGMILIMTGFFPLVPLWNKRGRAPQVIN
jgi:hypothetical protein